MHRAITCLLHIAIQCTVYVYCDQNFYGSCLSTQWTDMYSTEELMYYDASLTLILHIQQSVKPRNSKRYGRKDATKAVTYHRHQNVGIISEVIMSSFKLHDMYCMYTTFTLFNFFTYFALSISVIFMLPSLHIHESCKPQNV